MDTTAVAGHRTDEGKGENVFPVEAPMILVSFAEYPKDASLYNINKNASNMKQLDLI